MITYSEVVQLLSSHMVPSDNPSEINSIPLLEKFANLLDYQGPQQRSEFSSNEDQIAEGCAEMAPAVVTSETQEADDDSLDLSDGNASEQQEEQQEVMEADEPEDNDNYWVQEQAVNQYEK